MVGFGVIIECIQHLTSSVLKLKQPWFSLWATGITATLPRVG